MAERPIMDVGDIPEMPMVPDKMTVRRNDEQSMDVYEDSGTQEFQDNQQTGDEHSGQSELETLDMQESVEQAPTQQSKNPRESWGELRAKAERAQYEAERAARAERERDEAMRLIRELSVSKQQPQQEQPLVPDEEFIVKDDDLLEGKHLGKVGRKLKALEQKLERQQRDQAERERKLVNQMAEQHLRSKFPDIDNVASPANIEKLAREHPNLYRTLEAAPDLIAQMESAYYMIKNMGIYKSPMPQSQSNQIKSQIERNLAKPRTGPGRPLNYAQQFQSNEVANNPEAAQKVYAEMLQAIGDY